GDALQLEQGREVGEEVEAREGGRPEGDARGSAGEGAGVDGDLGGVGLDPEGFGEAPGARTEAGAGEYREGERVGAEHGLDEVAAEDQRSATRCRDRFRFRFR